MMQRAYFLLCLALGQLLRSVRYSTARIAYQDGQLQVRKHRSFYAPLLIWMGGPLLGILETGVRVLPQRDWEERERRIYRCLRRTSIRIDTDGMLVLPRLAGETLATLLEDQELGESVRKKAIERAVVALAEFHELGFTHGDAMAENVLIDLAPRRRSRRHGQSPKCEDGVAHWVDFETIHGPGRPIAWRRADDVRALLVTCLVRTAPERLAETLQLILDVYRDEGVTRLLATSFTTALQRPLTFHLAQAGLSFRYFREISRLLRERLRSREDDRGQAGVVAAPGRGEVPDKPLCVQMDRNRSGEQTIATTVPRSRVRASIDPCHRLIDRQTDDKLRR